MTMPFVVAKLTIRLIGILVGVVIMAIALFIFNRSPAVGFFAIIFGFSAAIGAYGFIVRVFGFAARVGHVAVLTETIKTGQLPQNQITYGKNIVVSKFATAGAFFVLNALIDRAVKQLQGTLGSAMSALGGLGMGGVVKFAQKFVGMALKFVDECIIGWIFYNDDKQQSTTKGAVDGIVIYFQNWKAILGGALKTTALSTLFIIVFGLVLFGLFSWILSFVDGFWGALAFFLGIMLAITVKRALLDSWTMISMLNAYMQVAPTTQIQFDVYGKLAALSPSFRKMRDQASAEIPQGPPAGAQGFRQTGAGTQGFGAQQRPAAAPSGPVFCGECGAKNAPGTQFCGECGKKV
ncbi:MAG: zinc ribbon domain-containing protein [Oscillospiraceae bacterium]|nr:zinc ribbon domain-containing protein [Oscillospiraceae bacterium]